MNLKNIFSAKDPKCVFCKEHVKYIDSKGNERSIVTYQCLPCDEYFFFSKNYFSFTISGDQSPINVHLFFKNQKCCIVKSEQSTESIKWLPMFDINFKNKPALYNKLKTYLTFS